MVIVELPALMILPPTRTAELPLPLHRQGRVVQMVASLVSVDITRGVMRMTLTVTEIAPVPPSPHPHRYHSSAAIEDHRHLVESEGADQD